MSNETENRIEAHLTAFSAEHRSGAQPDLWSYFQRETSGTDSTFLCGLIEEDFRWRLRKGESPWLDDYLSQHFWPHKHRVCRALTECLFEDSGRFAHDLTADSFGPYRTSAVLGLGGFGSVLLAKNPTDQTSTVAIKIAHRNVSGASQLLANEARVLSAIKDLDGFPQLRFSSRHEKLGDFIVLDYFEGVTLSEWLTASKGVPERLEVCRQLASQVRHLHGRVCHGDIAPDNIVVSTNGARLQTHLIDFGSSGLGFHVHELMPAFTASYAAPELLRGGVSYSTTQSDIWSLAVVIYQVLMGAHPFGDYSDCVSREKWLKLLKNGPAVALNDQFGARLRQVLRDCLCFKPEDRHHLGAQDIIEGIPPRAAYTSSIPTMPTREAQSALADARALKTGYLERMLAKFGSIAVPLIDSMSGEERLPIGALVIDLPLVIEMEVEERHRREREPGGWHTHRITAEQDKSKEKQQKCKLRDRLECSRASILVGQPGCGKSTLLAWTAYSLAARGLAKLQVNPLRVPPPNVHAPVIPEVPLFPIVLNCSDLTAAPAQCDIQDLIATQLRRWGYSTTQRTLLSDVLMEEIGQARAILIVDGLDEITALPMRRHVAQLLNNLASTSICRLLITSRVVGFNRVRDVLRDCDFLMVESLSDDDKKAYVEVLTLTYPQTNRDALIAQVCHNPRVSRLCENALMLALVAQLCMIDCYLPSRRVDIFRRLVQIMIERQRGGDREPLSLNEIWPHFEYVAYQMHSKGIHNQLESDMVDQFEKARQSERNPKRMTQRAAEDLLEDTLEYLGILNVAGTEEDSGTGYELRNVQFFHPSLQEYFAGRALIHGRGGPVGGPIERLRQLFRGSKGAATEVKSREISTLGKHHVEPVVAEDWQVAVPMAVAELGEISQELADAALEMILLSSGATEEETRAHVVLALRSLAEEPNISSTIASRVFTAACDVFIEEDGSGTQRTLMDDAIQLVTSTRWAPVMRECFLAELLKSRGKRLMSIGRAYLSVVHEIDVEVLSSTNATECIRRYTDEVMSAQTVEKRCDLLLRLVNLFFFADDENGTASLEYVGAELRNSLVEVLLKLTEDSNCAIVFSALWAMRWCLRTVYVMPRGITRLTEVESKRLHHVLEDLTHDENVLAMAAELLSALEGETPVFAIPAFDDNDWMYGLALIADRVHPQRVLAQPAATNRPHTIACLLRLLKRQNAGRAFSRIALALGRMGVFLEEMIAPLYSMLTNDLYSKTERDEALVYLALVRTASAAKVLVAATEMDDPSDDYLPDRGFFGLILHGDVQVIKQELAKGSKRKHVYLKEYAAVLAGVSDSKGREALRELQGHSDTAVVEAVEAALKLAEKWDKENQTK